MTYELISFARFQLFITTFVNYIKIFNDKISFEAIPIAWAKLSKELLC